MMWFYKTIDSILADITTKIEQLHSAADAHEVRAEKNDVKISLHTELRDVAASEALRARKIAAKFQELVS